MTINWDLVFSGVTTLVAITTRFQVKKQIELSNKQHLFAKRMELYTISNGLVELYHTNQRSFTKQHEGNLFGEVDIYFDYLTNNSYMCQLGEAIFHTLEQPFHKEFLIKLEELKKISTEIKMVFENVEAIEYSEFISYYHQSLFKMYQYKILINKIKDPKINIEMKPDFLEIEEKKHREELLMLLDNLNQSYNKIINDNVTEKIVKQIKLK